MTLTLLPYTRAAQPPLRSAERMTIIYGRKVFYVPWLVKMFLVLAFKGTRCASYRQTFKVDSVTNLFGKLFVGAVYKFTGRLVLT